MVASVASDACMERLVRLGLDPVPSEGPQAVTAALKSEVDPRAAAVRNLGLRIE